jgi:hypothetical protein
MASMGPIGGDHRHLEFGLGARGSELHPPPKFLVAAQLISVPSLPLVVPLPWLPDITPVLDPLKGIRPHRETQAYLDGFKRLDQALQTDSSLESTITLLKQQQKLTENLISSQRLLSSSNASALDQLKNRLRARTGLNSAQQSADLLLSEGHINQSGWNRERQFWNQQILPLVEINYWRSIDENGRPTDLSWRVDAPFQLLFLLDIVLRCLRLKSRYPAIRWREAVLRRWIDLPYCFPSPVGCALFL